MKGNQSLLQCLCVLTLFQFLELKWGKNTVQKVVYSCKIPQVLNM